MRYEASTGLSLGCDLHGLAAKLCGLNFSDVEEFATSVHRRSVLTSPGARLKSIVADQLRQVRGGSLLSGQTAERD